MTITINKQYIDIIIKDIFKEIGVTKSKHMLDSLKALGFAAATKAGISITLEDFKIPAFKKDIFREVFDELESLTSGLKNGEITDSTRFQNTLEKWSIIIENIKKKIIEYFNHHSPTNNLFIMAFSGARGNITQVSQLIALRGLMSNQEGKVIPYPILNNFRDGILMSEYLISAYGARKGVLDTALKTAVAGYLTRRLIFLVQGLAIRTVDCTTKQGILLFLKKQKSKTKQTNIFQPTRLSSPLSCQNHGTICQKCYGWNQTETKIIDLGEVIGIVAAQSIGEPGTQLTMRTFHTGGVYIAKNSKKIGIVPISNSGKALFSNNFRIESNYQKIFSPIEMKKAIILNWKGEEVAFFIK